MTLVHGGAISPPFPIYRGSCAGDHDMCGSRERAHAPSSRHSGSDHDASACHARRRGGSMVSGPGGFAGDFVAALAGDFAAHGAEAIAALRERNPNAYLRLCASVLRHKAATRDPLEDLTDAQLRARHAAIVARLADAGERPHPARQGHPHAGPPRRQVGPEVPSAALREADRACRDVPRQGAPRGPDRPARQASVDLDVACGPCIRNADGATSSRRPAAEIVRQGEADGSSLRTSRTPRACAVAARLRRPP